jgi:hypothetical protein
MSALAAIPNTLLFRALNEKQNRQMLSIPMHLPRSFGPAIPKHSSETIRNVVDYGSKRYMGTLSWTLSPYVMAHYAFSGLHRNSQGSAVLVDSSKMFGTIYNLTTRASRITANLSNRGHHLASSAQEIITADQPISEANGLLIGTTTASAISSGMSASTTLKTAARDLDDDAIQAIINMVPSEYLYLRRGFTDLAAGQWRSSIDLGRSPLRSTLSHR